MESIKRLTEMQEKLGKLSRKKNFISERYSETQGEWKG